MPSKLAFNSTSTTRGTLQGSRQCANNNFQKYAIKGLDSNQHDILFKRNPFKARTKPTPHHLRRPDSPGRGENRPGSRPPPPPVRLGGARWSPAGRVREKSRSRRKEALQNTPGHARKTGRKDAPEVKGI